MGFEMFIVNGNIASIMDMYNLENSIQIYVEYLQQNNNDAETIEDSKNSYKKLLSIIRETV